MHGVGVCHGPECQGVGTSVASVLMCHFQSGSGLRMIESRMAENIVPFEALGWCGWWRGCRLRTILVSTTILEEAGEEAHTSVKRLVFPDPLGPVNKNVGSSFEIDFR